MKQGLQAIRDMRAAIQTHVEFNAAGLDTAGEVAAFDQGVALYTEIAKDPERAVFMMSGLAMLAVVTADIEDITRHLDNLERGYTK